MKVCVHPFVRVWLGRSVSSYVFVSVNAYTSINFVCMIILLCVHVKDPVRVLVPVLYNGIHVSLIDSN